MNRKLTCFASVISEIQQSDIYLTVKARLFETPGANLNGVRVTPAFLAEIVDHQEKYVGLPLCADVKNLASGDYQHLGHLYDARTGEFHSAQIGSFYRFEQEETADGAALIGYARIMKRNKAVCKAISELFADGKLKFSFEISCGSYRELEDGTIEIDASEDNFLEGAAVVTFPACESAVALDLVAECNNIADGRREGEQEMTNVNETEVVAEAVAEESAVEPTQELAAKVVVEDHVAVDTVKVVDTETGNVVEDHNVHETHTETVVQDPEPLTDNSVAVVEFAESDDECAVCKTEENASDEEEDASCKKEKCAEETEEVTASEEPAEESVVAEESTAETAAAVEETTEAQEISAEVTQEQTASESDAMSELVASLRDSITELRRELAELKDQLKEPSETVVAEVATANANKANPFMADIQDGENKYSLLESEERSSSTYTLL